MHNQVIKKITKQGIIEKTDGKSKKKKTEKN